MASTCNNCGNRCPSGSEICPHCGCPPGDEVSVAPLEEAIDLDRGDPVLALGDEQDEVVLATPVPAGDFPPVAAATAAAQPPAEPAASPPTEAASPWQAQCGQISEPLGREIN